MKKFFKGFGRMLWRHKLLSIISFLALIVIIILAYMFCSIFVGGNDRYGNRLNGIKAVMLTKSELNGYASDIKNKDEVVKASVRLQGKIVYFDIVFKEDVKLDKAKEIANKTLEEFSDKEKKFYDFEYVLVQEGYDKKGYKGFMVTGTKGPKNEKISFIKS